MPDRPTEGEAGTTQFTFITDHRTAHSQSDRVDDGEAKSAATCRPVTAGVQTYKRFKNLLARSGRDAGSIIFDGQRCLTPIELQAGLNSRLAVTQSVVLQIIQHSLHQTHIQCAVVSALKMAQAYRTIRVDALYIFQMGC